MGVIWLRFRDWGEKEEILGWLAYTWSLDGALYKDSPNDFFLF